MLYGLLHLIYSPHTSRKRQVSHDIIVLDGSNSPAVTDLDTNSDYDVSMYATTSLSEGPRSGPTREFPFNVMQQHSVPRITQQSLSEEWLLLFLSLQ